LKPRIVRFVLGVAFSAAVGAGAAVAVIYWTLASGLPDLRSLADYRPALTSVVLDRQGVPIGEFYEFRRRLIPLEEVPERVIQAFLAAEDDSFYEHSGVDYLSILRAAWSNLRGETLQGASTITQQTVKQLLLTPERTYTRKIRELILARRIEERFSKDEILFLYLNEIYFGSGAYGIAEAARTYFTKEVGELTVAEAALIAGLPKAPSRFSPYLNPERAEERRQWVVGRMHEEGFIDAATHEASLAPPPLAPPLSETYQAAAYFTENVRRRLVTLLGNDVVLHGGLRIETTLDANLQRAAVLALQGGLEAYDHRHGYRGPVRRTDPKTLSAELEKLAEENALEAGAPETISPLASPWLGVVKSLDGEKAAVAFAPGVEATLSLDEADWAKPKKNLAIGDVARFRVTRAKNGALVATLHQRPEVQGALLAIDLENDDVLALVGGYDFAESELDRTSQSLRQPGSAFKPIVYATALAHGKTPASIVFDRPVVYDNFRPENYGRKFLGALTLAEALARSVNNAAVHLLEDVGLRNTIDLAHELGIRSQLEPQLGLALGSSSLTLLEITRAYAVFGAGGRRVEPRLVVRVLDRNGEVLLERVPLDENALAAAPEEEAERAAAAAPDPEPVTPDEIAFEERFGDGEAPDPPAPVVPPDHVLAPEHAALITSLLRAPVEHPKGTSRRAAALGRPVAGKTGTTNDHTDAWFVGFSPEIATGVWVGFDQNRLLGRGETGGRAALPIWVDFMEQAHAGRPVREFEAPPGVVFANIDAEGALAMEGGLRQAFLEGTEPTEVIEHTTDVVDRRRELELGF
jgi:penicillin-binding protein 1A